MPLEHRAHRTRAHVRAEVILDELHLAQNVMLHVVSEHLRELIGDREPIGGAWLASCR